MLYEFKCRATGSVVMTQKVAERILSIIGKSPGPTGIIVQAQMANAIAALEQAVAQERAQGEPVEEDDEWSRHNQPPPVSLNQRAWPLIEMLRAALAADREITWGV